MGKAWKQLEFVAAIFRDYNRPMEWENIASSQESEIGVQSNYRLASELGHDESRVAVKINLKIIVETRIIQDRGSCSIYPLGWKWRPNLQRLRVLLIASQRLSSSSRRAERWKLRQISWISQHTADLKVPITTSIAQRCGWWAKEERSWP